MFGRMRRGWGLAKVSLAVLRADKEIALLPFLSGIALVLTVGPLAGGGLLLSGVLEGGQGGPVAYAVVFLVYVVGYFVTVFFNAAVIACARIRFQGEDPTLRDGLAKAWDRKLAILQWSLLAATVGMVIRVLRERAQGLVEVVLTGTAGLAWNLLTYFVVPVIVASGAGPLEAIRESGSTMKETWGEALAGEVSVQLVFFVAAVGWFLLATAVAFVSGLAVVAVAAVVLGILGAVAILIAGSAADGILKAALYEYAETGELPSDFREADVPEAQARTGTI